MSAHDRQLQTGAASEVLGDLHSRLKVTCVRNRLDTADRVVTVDREEFGLGAIIAAFKPRLILTFGNIDAATEFQSIKLGPVGFF